MRCKSSTKVLFACFWLLGLCTNFAYVVMLSAAADILATDKHNGTDSNTTINRYDCNLVSTGAVLLANILPGIIVKLIAPFFVHKVRYSIRVCITAFMSALSFLIVALTPFQWLAFVGISFASMSASFGEITFLSLSTTFENIQTISGWSSGTGMAGLGGALSYAGLTSAGVSPRTSILLMLFIPVLMVCSYAVLSTSKIGSYENMDARSTNSHEEQANVGSSVDIRCDRQTDLRSRLKNRLSLTLGFIRPLLKYMIPLFFVYLAEYFINQGLFELLYFDDAFLAHRNQYRWYNVCYQLAVFVSRSSISFAKIKCLPIFPVLQLANVVILLLQIFYGFTSSIWVVFLIILWEGLLGGGCYVNAFYLVSVEIPKDVRESSIAITSIADSFGVALAGLLAIPVHNAICQYGQH
jgi:battenin